MALVKHVIQFDFQAGENYFNEKPVLCIAKHFGVNQALNRQS